MVFLSLRSGSKAGLLFHSKHASRRKARAHLRVERSSGEVTVRFLWDFQPQGPYKARPSYTRYRQTRGDDC